MTKTYDTYELLVVKTYRAWKSMIQRCTNPNRDVYKYYGGRGIKVCDRWRYSFQNFYEDVGISPNGMELDRINNNGNYEPSNCRWTTPRKNKRNRNSTRLDEATVRAIRISFARGKTVRDIAEELDMSASHIDGIVNCRLWKDVC